MLEDPSLALVERRNQICRRESGSMVRLIERVVFRRLPDAQTAREMTTFHCKNATFDVIN